MTTAQGLTEKLHAIADKELRARITKVFADCYKFRRIDMELPFYESNLVDRKDGKKLRVDTFEVLAQMEQAFFDYERDRERARVVDGFIKKVDGLADQIDEIRSQVEGG